MYIQIRERSKSLGKGKSEVVVFGEDHEKAREAEREKREEDSPRTFSYSDRAKNLNFPSGTHTLILACLMLLRDALFKSPRQSKDGTERVERYQSVASDQVSGQVLSFHVSESTIEQSSEKIIQ